MSLVSNILLNISTGFPGPGTLVLHNKINFGIWKQSIRCANNHFENEFSNTAVSSLGFFVKDYEGAAAALLKSLCARLSLSCGHKITPWFSAHRKLLQSFLQKDLVEPRHITLHAWLSVSVEKWRSLAVQLHWTLSAKEKEIFNIPQKNSYR